MDVSVGVLVIDRDRILLVLNKEETKKISGKSFFKPSKWGLPGGRGEPEDENDIATAERETQEETGLWVEIDPDTRIENPAEDHLNVGFVGYPVAGSLQPNPDEILECRWFPLQVLRNPDLLRKILKNDSAAMHNSHLNKARKLFNIACRQKRAWAGGKKDS